MKSKGNNWLLIILAALLIALGTITIYREYLDKQEKEDTTNNEGESNHYNDENQDADLNVDDTDKIDELPADILGSTSVMTAQLLDKYLKPFKSMCYNLENVSEFSMADINMFLFYYYEEMYISGSPGIQTEEEKANIENRGEYTLHIDRDNVQSVVKKYFGIDNYEDETQKIGRTWFIKLDENTYECHWFVGACNNYVYTLKNITIEDNIVVVTYDLFDSMQAPNFKERKYYLEHSGDNYYIKQVTTTVNNNGAVGYYSGSYIMMKENGEEETVTFYLVLDEDGMYKYTKSTTSSYGTIGSYTIEDNKILLTHTYSVNNDSTITTTIGTTELIIGSKDTLTDINSSRDKDGNIIILTKILNPTNEVNIQEEINKGYH